MPPLLAMQAEPVQLSLLSGVALAGLLFLLGERVVEGSPVLVRQHVPGPIVGGLLGAVLLLLLRVAGLPVEIPTQGRPVDFLVALLTTNMGLHVTPRILRAGALPLLLFPCAAAVLFLAQLALVYPLALGFEHPLPTALLLGPLSFVGAPYNLNPPVQVEPVAPLLRAAFADPEPLAQGMMMLGVLAGALLGGPLGTRMIRRAGAQPPRSSPRAEHPPQDVLTFSLQESGVLVLVLTLVAAAFPLQQALARAWPGFRDDYLPVILISYLLGVATRLLAGAAGWAFPEKPLTALLLGPTMGLVLTYALLSIPLHHLGLLTPAMLLLALPALAASAAAAWLLYPLLARLLHPYCAAVVATVFFTVTTGWGAMGMSLLHRFTDRDGEVEPMPAILPLNAFYLFPWLAILLTWLFLR